MASRVAFDDFGEAGNGFVGNAGLVATVEDGCHLRAGSRGQRDENHLDGLRRDDGGQRGAGAEDLHTMNEAAGLGRIVVDEAYDFVRQRWILVDLAEQSDSGVAGSIDESPLLRAPFGKPGEFERQSHGQAGSRRHPETEQEIQEIDGARKSLGCEQEQPDAAESGSGEVGRGEAGDIANGSISPPAAIQFEEVEDDDFGRHKDEESRQQVRPVLRRHGEVKSQDEREDAGDGEYDELNGPHHPTRMVVEMAGDRMNFESWHGDETPQLTATASCWSSGRGLQPDAARTWLIT